VNPLVLVVEDNPANRLLVQVVLERGGYHVATAGSAEEALTFLSSTRPELVLTDVQLPGRDGLALAREIRRDERLAGMPIVALTALAMSEDRERVIAAGCDGYIAKPINTRTLVAELEAILQARRAPKNAP
jgi:CheY-like chemotaxis protein